jgi:hypothetical protein
VDVHEELAQDLLQHLEDHGTALEPKGSPKRHIFDRLGKPCLMASKDL